MSKSKHYYRVRSLVESRLSDLQTRAMEYTKKFLGDFRVVSEYDGIKYYIVYDSATQNFTVKSDCEQWNPILTYSHNKDVLYQALRQFEGLYREIIQVNHIFTKMVGSPSWYGDYELLDIEENILNRIREEKIEDMVQEMRAEEHDFEMFEDELEYRYKK